MNKSGLLPPRDSSLIGGGVVGWGQRQQEARVTLKPRRASPAVPFPPFHFGVDGRNSETSLGSGAAKMHFKDRSVWGPNPGAPSVLSSQTVISILFFPGPPFPPAPPRGILLQASYSFKETKQALRLGCLLHLLVTGWTMKLRNGGLGQKNLVLGVGKDSIWIASL